MDQEITNNQNNLSFKEKAIRYYNNNKILILSFFSIIFIIIISVSFYISNKEKKKLYFSDKYVEAKIYLDNNENKKATEILRNIILEDENTYAALSFFLILEENLINDEKELLRLFNLMLKDKKFEDEIKNLIIFKKAIYESNFVSESELLETLKPLINSGTIWKPHALLLLGDYYKLSLFVCNYRDLFFLIYIYKTPLTYSSYHLFYFDFLASHPDPDFLFSHINDHS